MSRLNAVRLGVLGAISVGESLQIETGQEVHRLCDVHEGAARGNANNLIGVGQVLHFQKIHLQNADIVHMG